MEGNTIYFMIALIALVIGGGGAVYFLMPRRRAVDMQALMGRGGVVGTFAPQNRPDSQHRPRMQTDQEMQHNRDEHGDVTPEALEALKRQARSKIKRKKLTLEERFFRAGIFTVEEKNSFLKQQRMLPFFGAGFGAFLGYFAGVDLMLLGAIFGGIIGYQLPSSVLDRKIKQRSEDIMFYLPLVIEQIIIGVSSSLDVGPCIQRVVSMADERDTHNPVTELLRHAQLYAKSGISFEESMTEVGGMSGHTELKHAFMSLAQVVKHGGEITKQLQELADAVSAQRETTIETKIKKLELEATGPVGLVFLGFIVILLVGLGANIQEAFK